MKSEILLYGEGHIMDIDSKIVELIKIVEHQKNDVLNSEKESKRGWKTNCSLNIIGFPQPLNIQTASIDNVVKAYGMLLTVFSNTGDAAKYLDVQVPSTYDGYSLEDWVDDFKKRVAVIQLKTKKEKLNSLEDRLNGIVSPETRRQMELEIIMKEMGQ